MVDRLSLQCEALKLKEEDRAAIASVLLHSLEPPSYDVSDQEVMDRRMELEAGEVDEISHQQLLDRMKRPDSK